MYANVIVANQQFFVSAESLEIFGAMVAARVALDIGDDKKALHILRPYLEAGNPEAEYLYASCPDGDNSDKQIEDRHLEYIRKSANAGYPPALYLLGAYYDSGDYVQVDKQAAAQLFARGALLGHVRCQWIHGGDLLYGRNGISKDETLGLTLIQSAAAAKLFQALETVESFYENGLHGFPKDLAKAKALRDQMLGEDVIRR